MFCVLILATTIALAAGAEPIVNCPAPRSPDYGQSFLYQEGKAVKYVCEPGYELQGPEIVRCVDGQWDSESPECLDMNLNTLAEPTVEDKVSDPAPPIPPISRPLFSWGDEDQPEPEDTPQSDQAMIRRVIYPRYRRRQLRTTELEDNRPSTPTTLTHPRALFVRTINPKSSSQLRRTAPVVEDNDVETQSDKGGQSEEALRHMYWWSQEYYPRHASMMQYYYAGNPAVQTLSESQIAWINSLHPELRDQYLKDMYVVRARDADETSRAHAAYLSNMRRYGDDYYNYYYHHSPMYLRQPVSIVEDPTPKYDYTCHQAHSPFVRAPKLPNAHIARYDRRQNTNAPHNNYLSAMYRCNPGYVMLDTRHTELNCSRRRWVGTLPVCVPRG